ncbi:hypothetical protein HaLaN_10553 [Haematococcus lacustris]|uniref:Uncharacterized protein n=1 Tax=Haematococcus lacustris TaxID=44745 RepID=A0A699Z5W2_HAELA|nr:hypothetical protein HaLaN_10553 [Haematococcus lacustris]
MQACSTSGRAHIAGRPSAHSMGAAAPRPCWQRHASRPYPARQTLVCATKQTFTSFDDMIANSQVLGLADSTA